MTVDQRETVNLTVTLINILKDNAKRYWTPTEIISLFGKASGYTKADYTYVLNMLVETKLVETEQWKNKTKYIWSK